MYDVAHVAESDVSALLSAPHGLYCLPMPDRSAFRDGVLAAAVDEAVGLGSLYFSSAGNRGNGYRFMSVRVYMHRCGQIYTAC